MPTQRNWSIAAAIRLWVGAMVLSACAAPATATPTASPPTATTPPATATAEPLTAKTVQLIVPTDLAFDAEGNLYLAQSATYMDIGPQLYKFDPAGLLTVLIITPAHVDGGLMTGDVLGATGVAVSASGEVYVVDHYYGRIRRIDRAGLIYSVAGDGTPASPGSLASPTDVTFDAAGNMYILDSDHSMVRKVDPHGVMTTIAGNGTAGFSGDGGPATQAQLNPNWVWTMDNNYGAPGLTVDADGNLYISDSGNARVRKVDTQGIITTVAGTGEPGYSGDGGPATAAQLSHPTGLVVDAAGNLYIADTPSTFFYDAHYVRKVDTQGVISTIAGVGYAGALGDGGPAVAAELNHPAGLAFDALGNLYIVDSGNSRVRRINPDQTITTVVGRLF